MQSSRVELSIVLLIIGALLAQQVETASTGIPTAMLLFAALIALLDYARGGAVRLGEERFTTFLGSREATALSVGLLGAAAAARPWWPTVEPAISALGLMLAVLGAGLRLGLEAEDSGQGAEAGRPDRVEVRFVVVACGAIIARLFFPAGDLVGAVPNLVAACAILIGYSRRPLIARAILSS